MTLYELLEELKQIDPEESGAAMPCKAFKPKGDGITTCVCCGRKLTHPESVKDGMGPICSGKARRYGGYHETNCKD